MSRYFKSIEFFGIPGCGKTYCVTIVKQLLKKKGYKIFNVRECVVNGSSKLIELSLIEKISLNYFRLINFKNKNKNKNISKTFNIYNKKNNNLLNNNYSSNYFKEIYQTICKKIIFQKEKKFLKILKEIENIIKDKQTSKTKQYLFWVYELFAAQIIFNNYFKNKNKNLLLLDEGLVQRSFTICKKILKKNHKKFFDYYFSKAPISNSIFLITSSERRIYNENIKRKFKYISKYKKNSEMIKFKSFLNSYLIKQAKFKFKIIKNNLELKKNLYKIF